MLGLICVAVLGGELAVEREEIRASVRVLTRLSATALVPRPGERPNAPAMREELALLVKFMEKHAEDAASRKHGPTGVLNFLQAARNTADAGAALSASPEERLVWQKVAIRIAEAEWRLLLKREFHDVPAPQRPQLSHAELGVRVRRNNYRLTLLECVPDSR